MEQFTECELPALLEEAMQVIVVLRWPGHDDDAEVRRAADRLMARLYQARREALEVGCRCCRRKSDESRLRGSAQNDDGGSGHEAGPSE